MRAIRIIVILLSSLLVSVFVLLTVLNQIVQQSDKVTNLLDSAQIYDVIKPQIRSEVVDNVSLDSPYAASFNAQLDTVLQPGLIKTMFEPVASGLVSWLREPLDVEPRLNVDLTPLRQAMSQPPSDVAANKSSDYQFFVKRTVPDSIEINPQDGTINVLSSITSLKTVVTKLPQMQLMLLIIIAVALILTIIASLLAKRSVFAGLGFVSLGSALVLAIATLTSPSITKTLTTTNNAWIISVKLALASTALYGPYILWLSVSGAILCALGSAFWWIRRRKLKRGGER